MEHSLKGKRILFFYLSTFNYEKEIVKAMKKEGAIVDAFNERPSNNTITRVILKFNRNIISKKIDDYYDSIIELTKKNKYDFIFFIKGESISRQIIERLKNNHPEAKILIYLWDSAIWNKNAYTIIDCFDKVFTFDRADSLSYNINFLPLFYIPQYSYIALKKTPVEYDAMFVGTVHGERYEFINSITQQINGFGGKCFIWFYFPSKLSFYKMKLDNKGFRKAKLNDFHFIPLDRNTLLDNYEKSLVQLDLHDSLQSGLTMRTIETLGAKKKLITTNMDIVNYDFYNPENIIVVDRNKPIVPKDFFLTPYKEISEDIYNKYSISSWLNILFTE